jgi:histone-lysine N-methyltransferase SETMAR
MSVIDDARPHTAAATVSHIATCGWECLDHAPYSPDLVPSNFHFFPTLKRTLEGRRFTTMKTVKQLYRSRTPTFTNGFFKLMKRCEKYINVGGDYVEK